jgi:hypothetical protein
MVVPTMIERATLLRSPNFLRKNDEHDELYGKRGKPNRKKKKNYFVAVQYGEKGELH